PPPARPPPQPAPPITTLPPPTETYTTSLISAGGASVLFKALPFLIDPRIMEPLSLTYTTPPLLADVDMAGPASLRLYLSSLLPESDIQAVLADVWPDGSAHP
ncbi:CocE/NonD family hydrolase C-terminal non-catalytic domain-containing protein, partial [Acinetobacter baumannii]